MFFQVRANDGQTIAIRPYTELGNVSNPILLNALSAAQVPATDRTLVMVDTMMQEQMSIGRQSILDMAKLVGANPDANVQTIVQMTKLGLPVTEEMAAQFENYLSDRQALVGEMDLAAGHMMELLSDEALSPEQVKKWIREGRIEYKDDHLNTITMHCTRCGAPISFGTLCAKCMRQKDVSVHSSAREDVSDSRMRFIED